MNIALWVLQGLLAFALGAAGAMKVVQSRDAILANPRMGWASDFSASQIKMIGGAEVLGAIGLVLPWALGILPILTPIAAVCLAILMIGATATHARRKEPSAPTIVLAVLLVVIAIGRSGLV
jgi:hypothetical protein